MVKAFQTSLTTSLRPLTLLVFKAFVFRPEAFLENELISFRELF